jgi:hypothetical protein
MDVRRCEACGEPLPLSRGRGRLVRYCPHGCKWRAYRQRQRAFRSGQVQRNTPHLDLIYCAGDNARLTEIAAQAGLLIGIRSGRSAHGYAVRFVDVEYQRPNFEKHLRAVARHRPKYATVPDLSESEVSTQDVARALKQYEQLSDVCAIPLIVPKLPEQLALLPQDVAVGYSIPTTYGGVSQRMKPWHFEGRRIHLLGGSPHAQIALYQQLSLCAEVTSADGNMAQLMATQYARYWDQGHWVAHPARGTHTPDLYLDCWRWSCAAIRRAWGHLVTLPPVQLTLVATEDRQGGSHDTTHRP